MMYFIAEKLGKSIVEVENMEVSEFYRWTAYFEEVQRLKEHKAKDAKRNRK